MGINDFVNLDSQIIVYMWEVSTSMNQNLLFAMVNLWQIIVGGGTFSFNTVKNIL